MLFEENPCADVTSACNETVGRLIMPEAKSISIPSQVWAEAADAYCGDRLSETAVGDVVTVKEFTHGGFLYAVFATKTGGWSGDYVVYAWQLHPLQAYSGRTTGAICASEWDRLRARGDKTGMIVKVRGKKMVCAKPVNFVRSLPTVTPLSIEEAMTFELSLRKSGWRSYSFRDATSIWSSLAGHPVCTYARTDANPEVNILFWKGSGPIQEHMLQRRELLKLRQGGEHPTPTPASVKEAPTPNLCQASLF
jgi:hypothetical protein